MSRKTGLRMANSSRWAKYATVLITNEMKEIAENTGVNVQLVVADKLEQSYKDNLEASYGPRSPKGEEVLQTHKRKTSTYTNTHKLKEAVQVKIDGKYVKITLDKSEEYPDTKRNNISVEQVADWLTKGTRGGGYYTDENGEWHYNYPTPPHLFEAHTVNEMKEFLNSLVSDINKGKYTTYRYTGKKKKRTHYRGQEVI